MAQTFTLAEAAGTPPPPQGPTPAPAGTTYTLDQANTVPSNVSPQRNVLDRASEVPKDWLSRFSQHVNQAQEEAYGQLSQAGEDFKSSEREPFKGIASAGEGLLAVSNWLWGSSLGAAYKTAVGDPITAVGKRIPAADDLHPIDTKTHQFKSTGVGFEINRADIDQTTASINDFMETVVSFAAPGGSVKKLSPGAFELLTPEAKATYRAREAAEPKKMEGAFDTLISKSPEGADQVATEIGKLSPETEKYLRKRIQKFVDASENELNYIGREAAKANIEDLEGKMPRDYVQYQPVGLSTGEGAASARNKRGGRTTGENSLMLETSQQRDALGTPLNQSAGGDRPTATSPEPGTPSPSSATPSAPRAQLVTNEQLGASLRTASKDLYSGLLDHPDLPQNMKLSRDTRAIVREGVAARRARELDELDIQTEPRPKAPAENAYSNIDSGIRMHAEDLAKSGEHTMSHDLLDRMHEQAGKGPEGEFQRELISKLRSTVPNTKITFHDEIRSTEGANLGGQFSYKKGSVKVSLNSDYVSGSVLHELVHAGTTRFFEQNPGHELTKEMNRLYELAKDRIARAKDYAKSKGKAVSGPDAYGMTNMHEFVAEAMTNRNFQRFLAKSESFATEKDNLKNLYDKFMDIIQRVFGIKHEDTAKLLRNVISRTNEVLDKRQGGGENTVASDQIFDIELGDKKKSRSAVVAEGKLAQYYDEVLRTVNPEARGGETGKQAGAVIARNISIQMQKDTWQINRGLERLAFWDKNPKLAQQFIAGFEKGAQFVDKRLRDAADGYRKWTAEILTQDKANGIKYDPVDHYLPHIYENPKEVENWLTEKFGSSWSKPGFTKDRGFSLYEEAIKAGFKPRFKNPEDIMLARQHSSDIAEAKVNILKDLEKAGLALKKTEGGKMPEDWKGATSRPSPDGTSYWVHNSAAAILHNVYDTTSLWELRNMGGDAFRGAMALKNAFVPIKLSLSLFHPLHVATIDNATGMVRATKEMLAGAKNPISAGMDILRAGSYYDTIKETAATLPLIDLQGTGNRLLRLMQGKIPDAKITNSDRTAMQYMNDGGFIPSISSQYKLNAIENLNRSINQRSAKAIYQLPFAMLQGLGKPMFEHWIPSLKTASYLADVKSAIKTDPSLIADSLKRQVAFRKIAKSVDNRYGEMQYGTLFWNRTVKDIAVLNTLSLGWNLGFVREYGGGMLDAGQVLTTRGGLAEKAAKGKLDRPLFVGFYTTQALMYGGLMTYWMTGKSPEQWEDYVYPRTGQTTPEGKAERVNTMFYPREFGSMYKHAQAEGVGPAAVDIMSGKASGLVGLAMQGIRGVNEMGQQIRDPYGRGYMQVEQTVAATLADFQPIATATLDKGKNPLQADWWKGQFGTREGAMTKLGFSKAPKYASQSKVENEIDAIYQREYTPKEVAYDRAMHSKEVANLRRMYKDDDEGFDDKLAEIQEKFQLTDKELAGIKRSIRKDEGPSVYKFSKFSPAEQKHILNEMTDEEREKYLKHASKKVRYNYAGEEQ